MKKKTLFFGGNMGAVGTPVTFDAVTTNFGITSGTANVSHTTSGSDRYLILKIGMDTGATNVSTATYNGVAMTLLKTLTDGSDTIEMWGLVNPSIGSNNLAITFSGSIAIYSLGICSYYNVNQTTPTGTLSSGTGTGISSSLNVTLVADDLGVDVIGTSTSPTIGAGQTQEFTRTGGIRTTGSYEANVGSTPLSWSFSSQAWLHIAIALKKL